MMTKQQFIHNKWSELGIILLKSEYDSDGWIDVNDLNKDQITDNLQIKIYKEPESNFETTLCRPKSLKGIENNNGWTKMTDQEYFPNYSVRLKYDLGIMNDNGQFTIQKRSIGLTTLIRGFYHHGSTHYREVIDEHPIY